MLNDEVLSMREEIVYVNVTWDICDDSEQKVYANVTRWSIKYEWINCLCKCYMDESEETVYVNVLHNEVLEEYEWISCLCKCWLKCYMDESEETAYVNVKRWSIGRVWVNKLFMWMLHEIYAKKRFMWMLFANLLHQVW
jgi:hypothetical protein